MDRKLNRSPTNLVWLLLMQILGTGCARYEFDLTRPADLATHVAAGDVTIARDPLQYRFNAVDGRLVMRIFNNGADAIQLIGPASTVVDPHGQSHPLQSQTIAPQSFIKLILPPLRPHVEQDGPSIGLGFGVIAGRRPHRGLDHPLADGPFDEDALGASEARYFYVADDANLYWDWDGESDARLSLAFVHRDQQFNQDFVFRRVKM